MINKLEIRRKIIHSLSVFIPLSYILIEKEVMLIALLPFLLLAAILELMRKKEGLVKQFFEMYFNKMMRSFELDNSSVSGATLLLLGIYFSILLFEKEIAIILLPAFIIADMFAAIIGINGKLKLFKKSFEGTAAFFVFSFFITYYLSDLLHFNISAYIVFIVSFIGAFIENLTKGIVNDNISVPISMGIIITFLMKF